MFFENQEALNSYSLALWGQGRKYELMSINYLVSNQIITADFLKTSFGPNVCSKDINYTYVNEKISSAMEQTICDMVVLVDTSSLERGNNDSFLRGTQGFMITEKGECKKIPEVHSISLICSKAGSSLPGAGSIMLGAYLFMIKSNMCNFLSDGSSQIGILDLAKSYSNVGGFCAYAKFGFKYLPELKLYQNCYNPEDGLYANLPMAVNVMSWTQDDVLALVKGTQKMEKGRLCDLRGEDQLIQSFLDRIRTARDAILQDNPQLSSAEVQNILAKNLKTFATNEVKSAYDSMTTRFNETTLRKEKIMLDQALSSLETDADLRKRILEILSPNLVKRGVDEISVLPQSSSSSSEEPRRFLKARTRVGRGGTRKGKKGKKGKKAKKATKRNRGTKNKKK
jgi:hypothetical protein